MANDVASVADHLKSLTTNPSVMSVSILVSTLVEELCSFYEHDPHRKEILFHVVCDQLVEMSLLSPLAYLDELAAIRARYRETFIKIIDLGQEMAAKQASKLKNLGIPLTKGTDAGHFVVMPSRYQEEFEELKLIGHGGFGRVYQARHRVDGQEYAVKKVPLPRKSSRENILKIFREVKVLAGLHHKHVVGYNAAWLELDSDNASCPSTPKHASTSQRQQVDLDMSFAPAPFDCSSHPAQLRPRTAFPLADSIAKELEKQKSRGQEDDSNDDSIVFVRTDSEQDMASKLSTSSPEAPVAPPPPPPAQRSRHQSESSKKRQKASTTVPSDAEAMQFPTTIQFQTATISQTPVVLFIQMELCGKTLRDWMRDRNANALGWDGTLVEGGTGREVDVVDCNRILKHVLKGIEYIHSKGLIHRDLKPRNIFFHMQDNRVMIGDFGLARKDLVAGHDGDLIPSPDLSTRRLSAGVGTVTYSSPEQLHGSAYDLKSDMFSLGIVMFELLSPFATEMERAICLSGLRSGRICPEFTAKYPAHSRVIRRLLQTDPKERPAARDILSSDIFVNKDLIIQTLSLQLSMQQAELNTLQAVLAERTFPGVTE
ncbi:Eukaryotic translation initiation factor 2-alpha kinase 1 [Hypsibius exemplaris]|uniref:Eukaryotic translation initiation factor 2-alpha kinase 1 n=1 Tax=Hypsibius exemplaris TaxID=2072580 RepID=A0A1W0WMZ3_HYPEX|nr:Eukaryotic translation initiation factor 2-alpha kinase 1 [Hypsibius exemplaris]